MCEQERFVASPDRSAPLTSTMKSSIHLPASRASSLPTQGAWKVSLKAVSEMSNEWGLVIMKGTHTYCTEPWRYAYQLDEYICM